MRGLKPGRQEQLRAALQVERVARRQPRQIAPFRDDVRRSAIAVTTAVRESEAALAREDTQRPPALERHLRVESEAERGELSPHGSPPRLGHDLDAERATQEQNSC